jgi:hypothetical protein
MLLDDDSLESLRSVLKRRENVKTMFGKFRERSKIKEQLVSMIVSKATENSILHDLAEYVKHMQRDLGTMIDIQEATTLNSIEFRENVIRLFRENLKLHTMTDDDLKKMLSLIELVDKDVKGFKEHEDILKWIDNYVKSQRNGDSEEDGR